MNYSFVMYAKRSCVLLIFILILQNELFAQRFLKVTYYQNLDVLRVTERRKRGIERYEDYDKEYRTNLSRPSLGVNWDLKNNNYTNGVELSYSKYSGINYSEINRFPNSSPNPSDLRRYFSSISYCMSRRIVGESKQPELYLGVFVTAYFYGILDNPTNYPKTLERNLGFTGGFSPSVCFFKRKRFSMNVSSKVYIVDWRNYLYVTDDPKVNAVVEEKSNLEWLPRMINFRLGLSYMLNDKN